MNSSTTTRASTLNSNATRPTPIYEGPSKELRNQLVSLGNDADLRASTRQKISDALVCSNFIILEYRIGRIDVLRFAGPDASNYADQRQRNRGTASTG